MQTKYSERNRKQDKRKKGNKLYNIITDSSMRKMKNIDNSKKKNKESNKRKD